MYPHKQQRIGQGHVIPPSPAVGRSYSQLYCNQSGTPSPGFHCGIGAPGAVQQLTPAIRILLPLHLISLSPFGAFCRGCVAPVSTGKGSIRHHLSKHPEVCFGLSNVDEFARFVSTEVHKMKSLDLSTYVSGDTFSGFHCRSCGACFAKRFNAVRHSQGKTVSCLNSDITRETICKTLCGRLIQASKVASRVPAGSSVPFSKTKDWLARYVPGDERVGQYLSIFHPTIVCMVDDSDAGMLSLVDLWCLVPQENEVVLIELLERATTWLFERARDEVGLIPANYRAAIQVFDGQNVGDVAINFTYTFRHYETNLLAELKYLIAFAWRRSSQTKGQVLSRFQRTYNLHRSNAYFVPRLLQALFVEPVGSGFEHPIIVEYCLARAFRNKISGLSMIKCDLASSQVAATMSILRAGLCSTIVSFPTTMDEEAPKLCQQARTSRVSNILCPFIRQLKEMHQRKGTKRFKTVSPEGDIAVDGFEFKKTVWSKLIADVFNVCKQLLSQLLVGDDWAFVLDPRLPISVFVVDYKTVTFQLSVNDETVYHSRDVQLKIVFEKSALDRLASYLSFAFFGLGGGATRGTEVDLISLSNAKWHRNTIYYNTYSNKSFSYRSQNVDVPVEHKLPAVIARCYLLFRLLVNLRDDLELTKLIPLTRESKHSLSDATTELFNFPLVPTTTQVRQFFTSISDYLFPDKNWDGVLCANSDVAEMAAHSASTHRTSYSTTIVNGRESVYRIFHLELGAEVGGGLASRSIVFSKQLLLQGLSLLVGPKARFTCPEQERLVELVANSHDRHAYAGLPCGTGKSMAWMVPAVARVLAGRSRKMIIVILPYKFLLQYHLATSRSKVDTVIDMELEGFDGQDIKEGTLPLLLQESQLLPNILFLSLEAMVNLIRFHSPKMKEWVALGLIQRIVVDEIHTLLAESFRSAYDFLPSLVTFEVPLIIMSGTVPRPLVPFLIRHLGMSADSELADVDLIHCDDCLGAFPSDFEFIVEQDERWVVKAVRDVVSILGSHPLQGVHVLTSSKKLGESFFNKMSATFLCRWVSADSTSAEQTEIAKEWSEGKFQILVSTTIALVGNENSQCHHVIMLGYMFSLMNVIQAIGRLRPAQRRGGSSFRIFVPVLGGSTFATMEEKAKLGFASLRNKKLIDDDQELFTRVGSMRGVYDWLVLDDRCRIQNLARRFGQDRPQCRICDVCRGKPTRTLAARAEMVVDKTNQVSNQAVRVLKLLLEKCILCNDCECNGEKCLKNRLCFRCGQPHLSKLCKDKDTVSRVLHNKACFQCLDMGERRGYVTHDAANCPLQRRLRRLVFSRFEPAIKTYAVYLNSIYGNLESFYTFIASFDRTNKTKLGAQVTLLTASQIKDGLGSPLLPPDIFQDVSFKINDAAEAVGLNTYFKQQSLSKKRKRGFVYGALYKDLFPGYFEVDHHKMGDVDILVNDVLTGKPTEMRIRSAAGELELMTAIVELGESMPTKGTCRRNVGDLGDMFALGYRSKAQGLIYKQTGNERTKTAMTSVTGCVGPFLAAHYPEVLMDIRKAEQAGTKVRALDEMGGEDGPGGSIMLSRNLGNSSHYDYSDGSASCSIWAEKRLNKARNWYFVLPNTSIRGSKGVVIKLRHGVAISWDGRLIRHCSSVTDVGEDNNVYGCMFGSCTD